MQTSSPSPLNITLALSPEKQAELEQRAAEVGLDVAAFVTTTMEEKLREDGRDLSGQIPSDQWEEEFRRFIANQRSRNPHFDDSRESIYD